MAVEVVVGVIAGALSLPLLTWALLARPQRARQQTLANLQRGLAAADDGVGPKVSALGLVARRLTPPGSVRRLERLSAQAGRPAAWPLDRLLAAKLVLPVLLGGLSFLLASNHPSKLLVGLGVVVTVVGWFVPELLLHSRSQERSQKIQLELADTLDQMTIAVEAGLGFDAAMARSGRNGTGPLAQEMLRTLQDIQVGHSRAEAYQALGTRTNVPDLRRFVRAIIQGDRHGISIADVLRTQAREMRLKRRQRAEEKAMQIPVKVIFPLMFCILPVLFIVLLGPTVINVMQSF